MTNKEFYQNDKKYYEVKDQMNFKELERWTFNINQNYRSIINENELQELIDYISMWYEIKFPDRYFEEGEGVNDVRFNMLDEISYHLSIDQLKYRLDNNKIKTLDCDYRGLRYYYDKEGIEKQIVVLNDNKNINIDISNNGLISSPKDVISRFTDDEVNTADELLTSLIKNKSKVNYDELLIIVNSHIFDNQLREIIIKLVAYKLLYSPNTNPKYAYYRLCYMIKEFNNYYNICISTKKYDELITDYLTKQKIKKFNKR